MSVALVRYDAACRAIAAAKTVDEAKKIRNHAEAMRAYARLANNKQLEVDAAEIRIRAERRVGELIGEQKKSTGLARGAVGSKVTGSKRDPVKDTRLSLKDAGIGKHLADRGRKLAAITAPEFEVKVIDWRSRIEREHERVTTNLIREDTREQKRTERITRPLPPGTFRLLYADPPWRYEHVVTESRAIENQYPTMALEDICAIEIPAADDALLFLWATSPKLAEAMAVLKAWRFDYRTCAVWDKETIGMGYYFRQQHELLLVAARGALPAPEPSTRPPSIFRARRAEHSAKPDLVYDILEAMYPTFTEHDRIELFARAGRRGWAAWSNEPALAV